MTGKDDIMNQSHYQNEFEKLATSKLDLLTLVEYLARQVETVFEVKDAQDNTIDSIFKNKTF